MRPRRGEVWLFDLGMTAKVRPVLVVSVEYGDLDRAIVTIVPHTTEIRGGPFEISIKIPFLRPGDSEAWSRQARSIGSGSERVGRVAGHRPAGDVKRTFRIY